MAVIELVRRAAWRSAPWGAAQGTTHEIQRWPDGAGGSGPYLARVSVADIEADGPFTPLPGYRRWLAVLDGSVELTIATRSWRGSLGETVAFDGADAVHAAIVGPARVWNLIVREHIPWRATWHAHPTGAAQLTLPGGVAVVYDVATAATHITTSAQPIEIALETAPAIVVHLGLGGC